jgi:hypothetical protein
VIHPLQIAQKSSSSSIHTSSSSEVEEKKEDFVAKNKKLNSNLGTVKKVDVTFKDPNLIEYNYTAGVVGKVIDVDTVAEIHGFERSDIVRETKKF